MRRSRRRTPDRLFRISAKAHALAMQGRQPPMGGQSLIMFDHPGRIIGIQFLSGFLWVSFQWSSSDFRRFFVGTHCLDIC